MIKKVLFVSAFFPWLLSCGERVDLAERRLAGGETTSFSVTSNAFSFPAPNLTPEGLKRHLAGDLQFEAVYVTAPSTINPGLGPLFNTSSCISCHPKDGRAAFPDPINKRSGFLMRTSIPGTDVHGGPKSVPGFGLQIQNQAVFGFKPEAAYVVHFQEFKEVFPDGEVVILRKPIISLINPFIPLPEDILLSPRIGTPMFGLGLLEAIPEADILALEDIDDEDGDGISGKANYVWDPAQEKMMLGRFGWKANVATLESQTAIAFIEDMGITSPAFPLEHLYEQHQTVVSHHPEISQQVLDQVVFYCQTLAVPAPRHQERKDVRHGALLFDRIGCAKCHVPKHMTGESSNPALAHQTIYPYTDMLLHDMGEGLADHRPDFLANGREWRTRPLWGIGLTAVVNGHTHFLHDGRARNLTEAILWHGGEAAQTKARFKQLSAKDRQALITFVNSL